MPISSPAPSNHHTLPRLPLCPNEHTMIAEDGQTAEVLRITCGETDIGKTSWSKSSMDMSDAIRYFSSSTMAQHERECFEALVKDLVSNNPIVSLQQDREMQRCVICAWVSVEDAPEDVPRHTGDCAWVRARRVLGMDVKVTNCPGCGHVVDQHGDDYGCHYVATEGKTCRCILTTADIRLLERNWDASGK